MRVKKVFLLSSFSISKLLFWVNIFYHLPQKKLYGTFKKALNIFFAPVELVSAQQLAEKMMKEASLSDWSFCFDRAKKRFGQCNYARKIISLSRHLVELNSESVVKDVIIHEIAHAIAGHKAGHGKKWKTCVEKMGGVAERCYNAENVKTPTLKYTLFCRNCETKMQRQKRPGLFHGLACKACCKAHNNGKFSRKFLLELRKN
jgi:predicted SprT family Zn-dependent metalloprotease